MKLKIIRSVFALLLLLGLAWTAYQKGWLPHFGANAPKNTVNIYCDDLAQGCNFKIENRSYTLKSSAKVSTSQPVELKLSSTTPQNPEQIHLTWAMQGMDMASNRYRMLEQGKQQWSASTVLPICSQQRQDWLLTLTIDNDEVRIQTQSH